MKFVRSDFKRSVLLFFLVALAWFGGTVAPRVEAWLDPVGEHVRYADITRGEKMACWRWFYIKSRRKTLSAALIKPEMELIVDGVPTVDAQALIGTVDPPRYFMPGRAAPGDGNIHDRVVCADLERARITPNDAVEIRWQILYETHGLWRVSLTPPAIILPAIAKR